MIDYLFQNRPRYLLIDEIDKSAPKHQTFLLNLMETGIISETKFGKTRGMTTNTSVFATSNDIRKLSAALRSRFFEVRIESYTYGEFYGITLRLLHDRARVAPTIADAVWSTSKNLRDCVRIGRLARTEEDVEFLVDKFINRGAGARN
jgi:Holliday junction DNA helicase RuvB